MDALQKCGTSIQRILLSACLLQVVFFQPAHADFINGGFEDTYTPDSTTCSLITGWTQTGYYFNGSGSATPTSINDLGLQPSGGSNIQFCGVTDIIAGTVGTLSDYFLEGATPTPTLALPLGGSQSVSINLRSVNAPLTKVGRSYTVPSWTNISNQATSISQQYTILSSDVDAGDGKVHIRFLAAPVIENPGHSPTSQPFVAFQLNNITTGRTGSNPLFFERNYAGQPGVPWKSLSGAGSNTGSASDYQYTDVQAFDIAPGNAFIHVGDVIELVAIASGCSAGGHDGHMYLDQQGTAIPPGIWVSASGPISTTPGNDITYTYTYINSGSVVANSTQIVAALPVQGTPTGSPASTTFVSVSTPTTGSCSGTDPVTCSVGTLQPGDSGTFQITVNVPSGWALSTGPVNNGNYSISATGASALLGPLVQTNLIATASLSNLVVDVSGLPTTASLGAVYAGTILCSNAPTSGATGDAPNASCEVTNLPAGLSVTGCTVSPSSTTWSEPATIPTGETVTCTVGGTPTTLGAVIATVSSDATNNSNSTTNTANATITVSANHSNLIANTSGLPKTATVGSSYNGSFSCSNTPTVNASSDASNATCDVANLPAGLGVTTCVISPFNILWFDAQTIPSGERVTCRVSGKPKTKGSVTSKVTTDASNNSNSTDNHANAIIDVAGIKPPATVGGTPVISPVLVCCGRPVILGDLQVEGPGPTVYTVTGHTGDATCIIGHTPTQTYLKMIAAQKGSSCTVVGTKNGFSSAPFTVVTP